MELLERFARGEMDAFEALFRQYQADVYRWTMRIVRDHAAAEDITMEAFLRAWKSHSRINADGNFAGWMRRIATNLALDHLQRAKRIVPLASDGNVPRSFEHAGERSSGQPVSAAAHAMNATPSPLSPTQAAAANPALRRESREQIEAAFQSLTPKVRAVALLALIEDVPRAEIAEALGVSESAVRVRVHRATQQLREFLRQRGARA